MSLTQTTLSSVVTNETKTATVIVSRSATTINNNHKLQDNYHNTQIQKNNQQKNHRMNRKHHKRVPWLKPGVQLSFHEEILSFASWVSPTPEEHQMRRDVIQRVKNVVLELWPNAKVDLLLITLFLFLSQTKNVFQKFFIMY
jgi:DNA polymerase sigma